MLKITAVTKAKLRTVINICLYGIIGGTIFASLVFGFTPTRALRGGAVGLLITFISSYAEIFLFDNRFKAFRYRQVILYRVLFYSLVISFSVFTVLSIYESLVNNVRFFTLIHSKYALDFLKHDFPGIFVFSIFASFFINFILQVASIVGRNTLWYIFIGKYNRPTADNRVFMFLDMKSSVQLGETLGSKIYSEFLQDFFRDITEPIEETGAEIYQYVGDEVVLTWEVKKDKPNDECLRCFFMIEEKIIQKQEYYQSKYGMVPEFKAGVNAGRVILTEVGDTQKEIVYHGDVVNTASRIEEKCNELNCRLLVSKDFINILEDNNNYTIENLGSFNLKGKARGIELFTIINSKSLAV